MTATDGGKDEISVDFDWFSLMTGDPHRCTAFLENVKVLNFVQPLRMSAIYIFTTGQMCLIIIFWLLWSESLFLYSFYTADSECQDIYKDTYTCKNSFLQILCSLCQLLGNTSLNAKATPVILPFWYTCLNCLISMTWHPGDLFTALALLDFLWFLWNWPQITQACQFILDPKGVPLLPFCDSNLLRCDILQFRHKLSNT